MKFHFIGLLTHLHIIYYSNCDYLMTEKKARLINSMKCRFEQHLVAMVMGLMCLLVYLGVDFEEGMNKNWLFSNLLR